MSDKITNIITIGASAGGITAVSRLCAGFKDDFDAAIFIVIHVSKNSLIDVVIRAIQKQTSVPCKIPGDGEVIQNKHIYLAPPDHHMMLENGRIKVQKGAYENHWRPSIDVLFRTAAAAYGNCVTGIILTGMLDDGSSGMLAIKRSGGRCIIQDPAEAEFADMPKNVLRNTEVDYVVPIDEIGYILADLYSRSECETKLIPDDVKLEAEITLRMSSNANELEQLGQLTHFTCPDCGGSLIKISTENPPRYRCYTGHSFSEKSLHDQQVKGLEESLWVAIRMMEERKNLLREMSTFKDDSKIERSEEIHKHIDRLKEMLQQLGGDLAD